MRDIPPWLFLVGPFLVVAFPPLIIVLAAIAYWEWSDGNTRLRAMSEARRRACRTLEQEEALALADRGPLPVGPEAGYEPEERMAELMREERLPEIARCVGTCPSCIGTIGRLPDGAWHHVVPDDHCGDPAPTPLEGEFL